ncbi:MAG: hypothetical protein QNL68_13715, partial [Akkermansiaceae bacterium]
GDFHRQNTQEMPSRALLEALWDTETVALKMLGHSRNKRLKFQQYEFRKTRYYALLAFFLGFLKEHGFQKIVFSQAPQRAGLFILLKLAEEQGLELKIFHRLPFGDSRLTSSSLDFPEPAAGVLSETIAKSIPRADSDQLPSLIKGTSPKASSPLVFRIPNALARRKIKTISTLPTNFIYFPLDQSSASEAAPFAGSFTEPYLAILTLARALPSDTKLLVQEQESPCETERSPEFYQILSAEPKIAFAKPTHDRLDLIRKAKAVATLSGNVGWIGALLGKSCIILGSAFYQEMPGVHCYQNPTALRQFIESSPQPGEFNEFLARHSQNLSASLTEALTTSATL